MKLQICSYNWALGLLLISIILSHKITEIAGIGKEVKPDWTELINEQLFQTFRGWGEPKASARIESLLKEENANKEYKLTAIELLDAAGYSYESHYFKSADGYITQLVRILASPNNDQEEEEEVNQNQRPPPLVPVVLYGGQSVSPAIFVQEAAELANRSLALSLTSAGHDVWLVPARGVDEANRGWQARGFTTTRRTNDTLLEDNYWNFSNDDIVDWEFGQQLELVLNITQVAKLSLLAYCNGAFISLAYLASEPKQLQSYPSRVDTMIALGPAVFINPSNWILRFSTFGATIGEPFTKWWHQHWIWLCRNPLIRYTACKLQLDSLFGPSPIFQTFLSLQLLKQILPPLSLPSHRQVMQVADLKRFRRLDMGPIGNLRHYKQLQEPIYDLSQVRLAQFYLLTGENDAIAHESGIEQLKAELAPKIRNKLKHLRLARYNHLDLLSGWDVDERVVKPIVELLNRRALELEQINWRLLKLFME